MRNYKVTLVGVNVTLCGTPMKPDQHWTDAAKAAIEMAAGVANVLDHSRMSVEEIVKASLDSDWLKKVSLVYDRELITVKKLFETLNQVDADVELDILLRPEEGISEECIAGLISRCKLDMFTIEKMAGAPAGFLQIGFERFSTTSGVQIFAQEVTNKEEVLVD